MKWLNKIIHIEKHRILLNLILFFAFYAGSWISKSFILTDPYKRPDLMFYYFFLLLILLVFNSLYFLLWILPSIYKSENWKIDFNKYIKVIYIVCIASIILLPLLSLMNL